MFVISLNVCSSIVLLKLIIFKWHAIKFYKLGTLIKIKIYNYYTEYSTFLHLLLLLNNYDKCNKNTWWICCTYIAILLLFFVKFLRILIHYKI